MVQLAWHTLPAALLARGLTLRQIDLAAARELLNRPSDGAPERRIAWIAAILAGAALAPHERAALETLGIGHAQRLAEQEERRGLAAMATLIPHLLPMRQIEVRQRARSLLESCRSLADQALWRVLAPEAYPEWLFSIGVLGGRSWPNLSIAAYLERLSILPDLIDPQRKRFLEQALEGVALVSDSPIDGAAVEQMDQAQRAAQTEALATLVPFLPPDLRDAAGTLAGELCIPLPNPQTPAELFQERWTALIAAPQLFHAVAVLDWIAADLPPAAYTPLNTLLVTRIGELVESSDPDADRDLKLLFDLALPTLAPTLTPIQTAILLGHFKAGRRV